jgi:hypothetical protein
MAGRRKHCFKLWWVAKTVGKPILCVWMLQAQLRTFNFDGTEAEGDDHGSAAAASAAIAASDDAAHTGTGAAAPALPSVFGTPSNDWSGGAGAGATAPRRRGVVGGARYAQSVLHCSCIVATPQRRCSTMMVTPLSRYRPIGFHPQVRWLVLGGRLKFERLPAFSTACMQVIKAADFLDVFCVRSGRFLFANPGARLTFASTQSVISAVNLSFQVCFLQYI